MLRDPVRHQRSSISTERICRTRELQLLRKLRRKRDTQERPRVKMLSGKMLTSMRKKYLLLLAILMCQILTLILVSPIRNFFRKWKRLKVQRTAIIWQT